MGKKNKTKKYVAKAGIKILKSGKVKFSKDHKIDLSTFVNESVENSIVSRLDGIISKEDVVIDMDEVNRKVRTLLMSEYLIASSDYAINSSITKTIVIPINKKKALKCFDFLDDGVIGSLLRTSTFASIYKKLKNDWKELCKNDASNISNVLFVPKVMVFLYDGNGEVREIPFYVNVLIVAVPPTKYMENDTIEEISDDVLCKRYVNDMLESAIKCGCKDAIINPFSEKALTNDLSNTAKVWADFVSTQRYKENFNSLSFSTEEQNLFIVFNAQLDKVGE